MGFLLVLFCVLIPRLKLSPSSPSQNYVSTCLHVLQGDEDPPLYVTPLSEQLAHRVAYVPPSRRD